MNVLIWIVVSVLGLGAFSSVGASDASVTTEPAAPLSAEAAPAAEDDSDAISLRFAQRDALPPCGLVELGRATKATRLSPPATSWRCLQEGVGHRGAELVTIDVRRRDVTVHTFYRALPDGSLEIWTQRMKTSVGAFSSRWSLTECAPSEDIRSQPCAV